MGRGTGSGTGRGLALGCAVVRPKHPAALPHEGGAGHTCFSSRIRCDDEDVGTDRWLLYANDGRGFSATATTVPLPSHFGKDEFDATAGAVDCNVGGTFANALVQMDGQPGLDLVITDDCDVGGIGTSAWPVYPG